MFPVNLPWTRLVRYSSSADGAVKYGEPIVAQNADIGQLAQEGKLRTVFRLYGPLEPKDVPIIRCIGLNYKTHILETGRFLPTCPTVFTKPGPAVTDHDSPDPIPKIAQDQCDYEGELVIVIGRDGKNISAENAVDYVAGYTVGNDIFAGDWQREAGKAGPYAPLGPCLIRRDLLNEANTLSLHPFVNGEVRQESHTSDLCYGVRKLVEFCSQVGLFMKPPNSLKNRDEVGVKIESIGTLRDTKAFEE
ncbi:hypothetical protein BDV06DRAFT_216245 [Aspergillus oleicola]